MATKNLPVVMVRKDGRALKALVDTGCTNSMVWSQHVEGNLGWTNVTAFDGSEIKCKGLAMITITVRGIEVTTKMVVAEQLIEGIDFVIGMDVIKDMGGVEVGDGFVKFGCEEVCAVGQLVGSAPSNSEVHRVEDKDFQAWFDGEEWVVRWKWKDDQPPVIRNKIACYDKQLTGKKREKFEEEVDRWITEGILIPWEGDKQKGVVALMAVSQPTKNKIRPVLDFREVNRSVMCHTGGDVIDICADTLREWRMMEGEMEILDLKSAYLQIKVVPELWQYQLVRYKDKLYCLTRLGFGLCSAPKIMSAILKYVLAIDKEIDCATNSFVDDILVSVNKVPSARVADHLMEYGLETKVAEPLEGGAALGLKLEAGDNGALLFTRGNEVPCSITHMVTKRELFSICGKLVGHYPVAGWLRVACSFMKRHAEGERWEDAVGEQTLNFLDDVLHRVHEKDPVRGIWNVSQEKKGVIWCDASSLALGVVLEVGGSVVEDAAWLRKKHDCSHINVAELDALVKGVNLAVKWGLEGITVMTDSSTVYGWVTLTLSGERRVKTKGAEEVLIKRRLGALKALVDELGLSLRLVQVPSGRNKADELTRVKKSWLTGVGSMETGITASAMVDLKACHEDHHMGVERTLFIARQIDPKVKRPDVVRVVKGCDRCQSIDPAPVTHKPGELSIDEVWCRIAVDVTHYKGEAYLSVIDCGPGRFAVWRKLKYENAMCVREVLEQLVMERGPMSEVLMDNATIFRSALLREFFSKWNIRPCFRAAYRASGNGIIERHHRTIKSIAERGGISPELSVFWYNLSPRFGQQIESVPCFSTYKYGWRHPSVCPVGLESEESTVEIGEEVWVKPAHSRCTSKWEKGVVTDVNSVNNISVDGMPRHILDIRRVVTNDDLDADSEYNSATSGSDGQNGEVLPPPAVETRKNPVRHRRPPAWLADYVN